jgi:hypothetical protein
MATATVITTETMDGRARTWYQVSGHDFDGEYAITEDGRVLDKDGYPLTAGDREEIAVRNSIK